MNSAEDTSGNAHVRTDIDAIDILISHARLVSLDIFEEDDD
jgi:hypothetical protein